MVENGSRASTSPTGSPTGSPKTGTVSNFGTQNARAAGDLGKAIKDGVSDLAHPSGPVNFGKNAAKLPAVVTKETAKGAINVAAASVGVTAHGVAQGGRVVKAGADATKVTQLMHPRHLNDRRKESRDGNALSSDSDAFQRIKAEAIAAATEEEENSGGTRSKLLASVCFLEMMANFDAGVLPATIGHVMAEFDLNFSDGGVLGALVYLGLVVGAPITGWALTNFKSQRQILMFSAVLNCCGVLAFALAPNVPLLYVGRTLIGLTQAPLIVYMPVWVDLDCGHDLTHGGHEGCYNPRWRIPLYIQAVGVLSFAPLFAYVKGRHFNARGGTQGRIRWRTVKHFQRIQRQKAKDEPLDASLDSPAMEKSGGMLDTWEQEDWVKDITHRFNHEESDLAPSHLVHDAHSAVHHFDGIDGLHLGESIGLLEIFGHGHDDSSSLTDSGVCKQLEMMARSTLFVSLTLALSGLYFVVTGIQFWVTDYLTMPVEEGGMGQEQGLVVMCFSICSLTGPTTGVFFGGWVIDRQGGYKDETGKAAMDTLRTCSYFGVGAVVFSCLTAFATNFWVALGAMWMVLFMGGALLSPATGVCINSVHPDLRSFSSALSMFAYNILGYAAAPFTCGVIAQAFGLKWGFRCTLLTSTVCFLALLGAYFVSKKEYEENATAEDGQENSDSARKRFSNPLHSDNSPSSDRRSSTDSTESMDSLGSLDGIGSLGRQPKKRSSKDFGLDVKGNDMRSSLLENS
jgi:hypothetical protein